MSLFEAPATVEARETFAQRKLVKEIQAARDRVYEIECQLGDAEEELQGLLDLERGRHEWPSKDILLMVCGAPGNWPCEAAA